MLPVARTPGLLGSENADPSQALPCLAADRSARKFLLRARPILRLNEQVTSSRHRKAAG